MAQRLAALLLLGFVAACQSAGGGPGASSISALEGVGPEDAAQTAPDQVADTDVETKTGSVAGDAAKAKPVVETAKAMPSDDAVLRQAVVDIAQLHKAKGHQAALSKVFDCYRKAQSRDVTLEQSKICAVQDFAISRATENRFKAQGKTDAKNRTLIIAKRAPERIGALMQLKGMNQNQLNTFALYLHAVALPTFEKTRA